MKIDSDFQMRPYYCFVEWLTTYNNLDEYALKLHSDDRIDLPLSKFSLAISVLDSLFSELTLLAGETNIVVLDEAILGEEKSYPKPVLSEVAF